MQISRSKLPGFAQNAFCYSQTRVVSAETSFDTLIEGSKLGIGSELDMKITSDAGSAIPLIGVAHKVLDYVGVTELSAATIEFCLYLILLALIATADSSVTPT